MNRVFVLGSTKKPLMPCHPARARELLRKSKAAVFRMEPFTIILSGREDGEVQDIEFKASPGGKATGIALVGLFRSGARLLFGAEIAHRGAAVRASLDSRRSLRHGRRGRKTRYRQPRPNFAKRSRRANCGGKWLPPSVKSRVDNAAVWSARLARLAPVACAHVETVRFDTQK